MENPSISNHHPSADPRTAPVSLAKADAEIVWNKRYFRLGVWGHELVGGRDFVPWNDLANSDPVSDIEGARSLLGYGGPSPPEDDPVLIIGLNVVDALRMHPLLVHRCRFVGSEPTPPLIEQIFDLKRLVTAGTVFNAGWSEHMEAAVTPYNALLIRTALRAGKSGIIDEGLGSSWRMDGPNRGVFFSHCVR
jgi:hypothetical protein